MKYVVIYISIYCTTVICKHPVMRHLFIFVSFLWFITWTKNITFLRWLIHNRKLFYFWAKLILILNSYSVNYYLFSDVITFFYEVVRDLFNSDSNFFVCFVFNLSLHIVLSLYQRYLAPTLSGTLGSGKYIFLKFGNIGHWYICSNKIGKTKSFATNHVGSRHFVKIVFRQ